MAIQTNILVQGAKDLGQSMRPADSQDRVSKNFSAVYDETVKKRNEALKERKTIENQNRARVEQYMEKLPTTKGLEKIPLKYKKKVAEFAVQGKNEYAQAARSLANLDPSSIEYQNAIDTMNRVKTSFETLNDQFTSLLELKGEFAQDMSDGNVSSGNNPYDMDFLSRATTDELDIQFSPDGTLVFDSGFGKQMTLDDMPKYFNKDFETTQGIVLTANKLFKEGVAIDGPLYDTKRFELANMIRKGGRPTVLSLATDNFLQEGGLAITDMDLIYNPARADELEQKVIDAYMSLLSETAQAGKAEKDKLSARRIAEKKALQTKTDKPPAYELDDVFFQQEDEIE